MEERKLCYRIFKTSTEMEDWQRNEDITISSISPLMLGGVMDIESQSANCNTTIGAFVVYWRK